MMRCGGWTSNENGNESENGDGPSDECCNVLDQRGGLGLAQWRAKCRVFVLSVGMD